MPIVAGRNIAPTAQSSTLNGPLTLNDGQMGSTLFGAADRAIAAGSAAPQKPEIDRGSHGRVRVGALP